jgi:hypothetical protein
VRRACQASARSSSFRPRSAPGTRHLAAPDLERDVTKRNPIAETLGQTVDDKCRGTRPPVMSQPAVRSHKASTSAVATTPPEKVDTPQPRPTPDSGSPLISRSMPLAPVGHRPQTVEDHATMHPSRGRSRGRRHASTAHSPLDEQARETTASNVGASGPRLLSSISGLLIGCRADGGWQVQSW